MEEEAGTLFLWYSALHLPLLALYAYKVLVQGVRSKTRALYMFSMLLVIYGAIIKFYQRRAVGWSDCGCLAMSPLAWLYAVLYRLPPPYVDLRGKAVLITGCDSGFGHGLARRLDALGLRVFAACLHRDGRGARELKDACSDRLHLLQLDVTEEDQAQAALREVADLLEERGEVLFAVVNNAGVVYYGDAELMPNKYFRRLMEVNYLGLVRVTRCFLPLIRRSKGHVVNVASLAACCPVHSLSGYCASKAAVEAFSSALRQEMTPWGVSVSVIEPGSYETAIGVPNIEGYLSELWSAAGPAVQDDYGRDYFTAYADCHFPSRRRLDELLEALEDAVLSARPARLYRRGLGAWLLPLAAACPPLLAWPSFLKRFTFYNGRLPLALRPRAE